jgi:titin
MRSVCRAVPTRLAGAFGVVVLGVGFCLAGIASPASAESLVNLSGAVTLGGTPASGARVSFGGVSTTADQTGHYLLHPFSNTSGSLAIAISVLHGSVPLTVGANDQTEDVTFPTALATGTVDVIDGDGNPLQGVAVQGAIVPEPDSIAGGATTDGALLTWGFTSGPPGPTQAVCTTDASGTCSFPSLLHLRVGLQATVSGPYGNDSSYPASFSGSTNLDQEDTTQSATLTVDWTHSIIALRGTVTVAGTALSGAAVAFAGLSATTDANGQYAVHPFANTSGTLRVTKGAYSFSEPLSVGAADQTADVDMPFQPAPVQLSGIVMIGGSPASGATVTLGGLTTTADNVGHYMLQPFPGTVGTIAVVWGALHGSAPITIGNTDQTDDVNVPTGPLTVNVHVVDGDGNPIPNLPIQGVPVSSTSSVTGLTSDGSTLTWGVTLTGPPMPVCTTDASGACSIQSLLNLDGTVTATVNGPYGSDTSYPSSFSASATGSASSSPADLTLTVDWVHTLVTLSGTITIDGTPAANASVTYGGLSTTTDANGHYALHPFANTSGTLNITRGLVHGSQPVTLGATDQTADVNVPRGNIVELSGTVLVGSVADASTTVSFGGVSTTADSSGRYSLDAIPNSTGTLTTNDGVIYSSAPITVGATDQQEDITIPTGPTTATVITKDGSGNALPGLNVHLVGATTPSPVQGTTTSGAPITWGVKASDGMPITRDCTTDTSGECTFTGLLNLVGTVSASKPLVAGDPSYPTLFTSFTGSAPVDGAPLTLAFPNVAYIPSAGSVPGSVLVTTQGTGSIANPVTTNVPTSLLPAGASAPVGAIGYTVPNVPVGGSVDVFVQLPPGTAPTTIDKLVNGTLVDVSSIATISGNTITLHLTDGGLGDADGVANGTIVDPVVPLTGAIGTTATASVGRITVSYAGGFNIAGPYSAFRATCTSNDGGATKSSAFVLTQPLTVSGLSKGKTYTCTVAAKNGTHVSAPSPASSPVVLPDTPGAPGIALVSATIGKISVGYTPPSSNGGSAITGYKATCVSNNGGVTASSPYTLIAPIVVSGLSRGKTYTCTVTARNAVGVGPPSASSSSVLLPDRPGAPSVLSVTVGTRQVTLAYGPPSSNGGSAITGYKATCVSNNGGVTASSPYTLIAPIVVSGLSRGKTYTCTVTARNAVGVGPPSTSSPTVIVS